MTVSVCSIPVLASPGGFFLVQGEDLHDDVRTARYGARTGPASSAFRSLVRPRGSSGAIAGLPQWLAVGVGSQECRADGVGLRSSRRRRHQPEPGIGSATLPHLLAV